MDLVKREIKHFKERVDEEYRVHWLLDGLPAATKKPFQDAKGNQIKIYEDGFALGSKEGKNSYLNNHVSMTILYHEYPPDSVTDTVHYRIVGFEVVPERSFFFLSFFLRLPVKFFSFLPLYSIQHDTRYDPKNPDDAPESCRNRVPASRLQLKPEEDGTTVIFTYSVTWEPSNIEWTDRWQLYLLTVDKQIHWFSIINSLMIVLFLTGMVAMIMIRTLRSDLRKYNMPLDQDDIQEETGWKLVHGDVFRPPKWRMFLAVLCGTGVQVFAMYLITMCTSLVFSLLSFWVSLIRCSLCSFGLFVSSKSWQSVDCCTSFICPYGVR